MYVGQGKKMARWLKGFSRALTNDSQLLDGKEGQTFRFDLTFRNYGITTGGFGFLGFFRGYSNDHTRRELILSNVTIHGKMHLYLESQWFADYQEGAERRLASAALAAMLKRRIPENYVERKGEPQKSPTLLHEGRFIQKIEGVLPIASYGHNDISYMYHFNSYPAHTFIFASKLGYLGMTIYLPHDAHIW